MTNTLHLFLMIDVELCLTPNIIDQSIMKDEREGSNIQNGLGVVIEVSAFISLEVVYQKLNSALIVKKLSPPSD